MAPSNEQFKQKIYEHLVTTSDNLAISDDKIIMMGNKKYLVVTNTDDFDIYLDEDWTKNVLHYDGRNFSHVSTPKQRIFILFMVNKENFIV